MPSPAPQHRDGPQRAAYPSKEIAMFVVERSSALIIPGQNWHIDNLVPCLIDIIRPRKVNIMHPSEFIHPAGKPIVGAPHERNIILYRPKNSRRRTLPL